MVSLRGAVGLLSFLVIMPALCYLVAKYLNWHGTFQAYRLSQVTGMTCVIGLTAVAFAPAPSVLAMGLILLSLGSSFSVTTRSLATGLILPNHVGTLYSAIAIAQNLGIFFFGPISAYLFKIGIHWGRLWFGLPFLQNAVIFLACTLGLWFVRLHKPSRSEDDDEDLHV